MLISVEVVFFCKLYTVISFLFKVCSGQKVNAIVFIYFQYEFYTSTCAVEIIFISSFLLFLFHMLKLYTPTPVHATDEVRLFLLC